MKSMFTQRGKLIVPIAILAGSLTLGTVIVSCQKENNSDTPAVTAKSYSDRELFAGIILARGPVAAQIPEYKDIQALTGKIKGYDQVASDNYANTLLEKINEYYPGYLAEFKNEILSKDYVRVDAAIKKAADIATQTVFLSKLAATVDPSLATQMVREALVNNPGKFEQLMSDIRGGKVNKQVLNARANEIFGENFGKQILARSAASDAVTTLSDECINAALAINVAIVINVVGYINVALAANIETGVNIHFAVNVVNEVSRTASNAGLKHEQLISSIVSNI